MSARLLRRLGLTLLGVVALCALLVVFALNSRWALRTAVPRILDVLPVDVQVAQIDGTVRSGMTFRGVQVKSSGTTVALDEAALSLDTWALVRRRVVVRSITLSDVVVGLPPDDASVAPPRTEPIAIPGLVAPLPIHVEALRIDGLRVTQLPDYAIDTLALGFDWTEDQLTVSNLSVDAPFATLEGELSLHTADDGLAQGAIAWTLAEPDARGQLSLNGPLTELGVSHVLERPAAVTSVGTVRLVGEVQPHLEFVHTCDTRCGVPEVDVAGVRIQHAGTLLDSQVTLTAEVTHARLPATTLDLAGRWQDNALLVEQLNADGASLRAQMAGRVVTRPAVEVQLDGQVSHVDAALIDDAVRGAFGTNVSARYADGAWSAVLTGLAGTVNDYALTGQADVTGAGRTVDIKQSWLALGDNRVAASGRITESTIALDADLALDDLAQIDTRLAGNAQGTLVVGGRIDAPALRLDLNAAGLRSGRFELASLAADVELLADGALAGSVEAQQIRAVEQDYGRARLTLAGTRDVPQLAVSWAADAPLAGLTLASRLSVQRDGELWRATIAAAEVSSDTLGQWATADAFDVAWRDADLTVDAHRWRGPQAFVDVQDARLAANESALRASLSDFPLASIDPFLPDGVRLRGSARANVNLSRDTGQWQGNVSWAQDNTLLGLRSEAASRRLRLERVALNAVLAPGLARAVLDVEGEQGVTAKVSVAALSPDALATSALDGTVDVRLSDISWLGAFVPGVEELAGRFALAGTLGGRVDEPVVSGDVALADGAMSLVDAGIRIEDIALGGTLDERFVFDGQARSGGGTLTLAGEVAEPWSTARQAQLNVSGENVQVLNDASYKVRVSPELELVYSADAGAAVSGRVDVPQADIRIEALPDSVVAASDDIQVAGRAPDEGLALPVHGEITLALGDEVHVFALGLDTDMTGDVRLKLSEGRPPRLDGRLALEDGTFAAYGQKLTIERGNVIYAGPIDNPTIDLRATRTLNAPAGSITAGVTVSGPAQQPEVALYSEPSQSETDTLSYLLLGRAADDTSGVEGEALSQAALAVGMSRSSPLTRQLAQGLGLDELTVGGDSVDAAELVAGKQINDRLYLRYSYGVFSNLGAILLRYRLSRRLTLEAGSADAQSLDLLYTIEK